MKTGDMIEVRNRKDHPWGQRIFLYISPITGCFECVPNDREGAYKSNRGFKPFSWRFCQEITKPQTVDFTIDYFYVGMVLMSQGSRVERTIVDIDRMNKCLYVGGAWASLTSVIDNYDQLHRNPDTGETRTTPLTKEIPSER